jgi:hypothetical protein
MATGIVLAYKRIDNLPVVVNGMLDCSRIDRVLIWNNSGGDLRQKVSQLIDDKRVIVMGRGANVVVMGRFFAANSLPGETVFATQDDDCLVDDWDAVFRAYDEHGGVSSILDTNHVMWGRGHYVHRYQGGIAYETLLGYGSVFPASALQVFKVYVDRYGYDELLLRKADRIFTILQNREHAIVEVPKVKELPGARDSEALYRQPDHQELNRQAYERCRLLLEEQACGS